MPNVEAALAAVDQLVGQTVDDMVTAEHDQAKIEELEASWEKVKGEVRLTFDLFPNS